jgi:hypothetical protein
MTKHHPSTDWLSKAWMVMGPDGAELETIRSTRSEAIEKFCDRAFHVPSAWAEHRKEGYRVVKVKVCPL